MVEIIEILVFHICHSLESLDGRMTRRNSRGAVRKIAKATSCWKRSRLGSQKVPAWQEVERTSFLSGDGEYIHHLKQQVKDDESSNDCDIEVMSRLQSGATASSSTCSLPRSFSFVRQVPSNCVFGGYIFQVEM